MPDHVHILISIAGRRKNFTGQRLWARGYYVSTVSRDEETVRNYIKHQEEEDKRIRLTRFILRHHHL
jgi:putative transposase